MPFIEIQLGSTSVRENPTRRKIERCSLDDSFVLFDPSQFLLRYSCCICFSLLFPLLLADSVVDSACDLLPCVIMLSIAP